MRHDRSRRGASAIEFALTLPVLVYLLGGIFEYSWMFYQRAQVVRCAREGVRLGVVIDLDASPGPDDTAKARAEDMLEDLGISLDSATVTATMSNLRTDDDPAEDTDDTLVVSISLEYDPLMGGMVPVPETLGAEFAMMLEDGA